MRGLLWYSLSNLEAIVLDFGLTFVDGFKIMNIVGSHFGLFGLSEFALLPYCFTLLCLFC